MTEYKYANVADVRTIFDFKKDAHFDFKVPVWGETKMSGELRLTMRQDVLRFKKPLINTVGRIFGGDDSRGGDDLEFLGRTEYVATLYLPVTNAKTVHDLFLLAVTRTSSLIAYKSDIKSDITCEIFPEQSVTLLGAFVKQSPYLSPDIMKNPLVVPLSIDFILPNGLSFEDLKSL